jgi:protein TonB
MHASIVVLPYFGKRAALAEMSFTRTSRSASTALTARLTAPRPEKAPPLDQPAPVDHSTNEAPPLPNVSATAAVPPQARADGAGILPIPGPVYYTADQLTKRAHAIKVKKLDAPEMQAIIVSGKLILKLWIDTQGQVEDVVVESSELPEIFAEVAVKAFRQSRFAPGERNGQRVASVMRIEVSYADQRLPARQEP